MKQKNANAADNKNTKSAAPTKNENKGGTQAVATTKSAKTDEKLDAANITKNILSTMEPTGGNGRGRVTREDDGRKNPDGLGGGASYVYPENVTSAEDKKAFRRRARGTIRKFQDELHLLGKRLNQEEAKKDGDAESVKSDIKKVERAYEEFCRGIMKPGSRPVGERVPIEQLGEAYLGKVETVSSAKKDEKKGSDKKASDRKRSGEPTAKK